jgi:REP element-mobilizing transposase RayT
VFWTVTTEDRAEGCLAQGFHAAFRELMLHAAARYAVWCPTYTLMPDHLHLLWMGTNGQSDQLNAMKFLRTETEPLLGEERRWQHQAHDHVLRPEEQERNALGAVCHYILENPVRAGLVSSAFDWKYAGAIVPGYPGVHPLSDGFWGLFWRLYSAASQDDA